MSNLLRQPFLKFTQFGVKKFAQPIPRVLQRSYGRYRPFHRAAPVNNSTPPTLQKLPLREKVVGVTSVLALASISGVFWYIYLEELMKRNSEEDAAKNELLCNINNKKEL